MTESKIDVVFVTPKFERSPSDPTPGAPPMDWDALRDMDMQALKEIGLRPWNDPNTNDKDERKEDEAMFGRRGVLMLLPGEWYRHIPRGFIVVDISGNREEFEPHVTDDDIRYGCLAYGIVCRVAVEDGPEEAPRD